MKSTIIALTFKVREMNHNDFVKVNGCKENKGEISHASGALHQKRRGLDTAHSSSQSHLLGLTQDRGRRGRAMEQEVITSEPTETCFADHTIDLMIEAVS